MKASYLAYKREKINELSITCHFYAVYPRLKSQNNLFTLTPELLERSIVKARVTLGQFVGETKTRIRQRV